MKDAVQGYYEDRIFRDEDRIFRALRAVEETPPGALVFWLQAWVKPSEMCLEVSYYIAKCIDPHGKRGWRATVPAA